MGDAGVWCIITATKKAELTIPGKTLFFKVAQEGVFQ
jgi:hypothetical protein